MPRQDKIEQAKLLLSKICQEHTNISDADKRQMAKEIYCTSLLQIHKTNLKYDLDKWFEILRTAHTHGTRRLKFNIFSLANEDRAS